MRIRKNRNRNLTDNHRTTDPKIIPIITEESEKIIVDVDAVEYLVNENLDLKG